MQGNSQKSIKNITGTVSLPTGAATAAKQDTGNTSLNSIDTKVPALGQALAAASVPVVLTAAQITTLTPVSAVTATLNAETTKVIGTVNVAAGQTIAVTNAGTFATQATLQAGSAAIGKLAANSGVDIGDVDVTSSALPTGASTLSEQQTQTASLSVMDDWDESDRAKVNLIVGQAGIAAGVGATGATVPRIVIANDSGRTLLSAGGSASSSGNNTLIAAGTNRLKVYAFSLSTVSTTAVTCIFQSGASGTELWRVILQTPASVAGGANLVVQPPAWLFATASATLLNLNLSAAVAVNWSVSYFDEA